MVKDTKKVAKKVAKKGKRIKKQNPSSQVVLNPKTKRYVKVTSKLGKEILAKQKVMKGGGGYNIKIDKMYITCKTKDREEDKRLYHVKTFESPEMMPEYRLFTDKENPTKVDGNNIRTIQEAKDSPNIDLVVYVTSDPEKGVIFTIMKFQSLDTSTGFDGSQNVVGQFDFQKTIKVEDNDFFVRKDRDIIGVKAEKIVEFQINNLLYVAASLDYHTGRVGESQPYNSPAAFAVFMKTIFEDDATLQSKLAESQFSSDDWYGNPQKLYKLLAAADFSSFQIPTDHQFSLSLKFASHESALENAASAPIPEGLSPPARSESNRPYTEEELLKLFSIELTLGEKSTSQLFHMPNDVTIYEGDKIDIVRFGAERSEHKAISFIITKQINGTDIVTRIFFTYVKDDGLGEALPYTYLEMHMVRVSRREGEDNNLSLISDIEIEELQSEFRKQESSLSNVFIIGKRKHNDRYLCIFYPVRLDVLLNKRNVTSEFTLALDFLNNYKK